MSLIKSILFVYNTFIHERRVHLYLNFTDQIKNNNSSRSLCPKNEQGVALHSATPQSSTLLLSYNVKLHPASKMNK